MELHDGIHRGSLMCSLLPLHHEFAFPAFFGSIGVFPISGNVEQYAVAHPPPRGFGAHHGPSPKQKQPRVMRPHYCALRLTERVRIKVSRSHPQCRPCLSCALFMYRFHFLEGVLVHRVVMHCRCYLPFPAAPLSLDMVTTP